MHRRETHRDTVGVRIARAEFLQREVHLLAEQDLHIQFALRGDRPRSRRPRRPGVECTGLAKQAPQLLNRRRADLEEAGGFPHGMGERITE